MYNIKNYILKSLFFVLIASLHSCKSFYNEDYKKPDLVDSEITNSVKELHKKLFYTAKNGFAIGHQDTAAYGIGWNHSDNTNKIKSDVNEVAGDFPAVYGFDISKIELSQKNNIDGVPFNTMRDLIIDAHKKGGIITISWHADNPTSDGDSWDKTAAVKDIIGSGIHKAKFESWVDKAAEFLNSLEYEDEKIPIIFRPYHEMNGAWFWWGEGNCTANEYKQLWQDTVHLLKDKHQLHHLLYVYSPNKLNPNDNYMKYYPGDDYVDILGIDIYDFKNSEDYIKSIKHDLKIVQNIASEKDKLFAFTETGLEQIPTKNWYTKVLYPNIENSGIAWILFWRNARTDHHYMPYKGHTSENDFKTFKELPKTLFLKDINNIKY